MTSSSTAGSGILVGGQILVSHEAEARNPSWPGMMVCFGANGQVCGCESKKAITLETIFSDHRIPGSITGGQGSMRLAEHVFNSAPMW